MANAIQTPRNGLTVSLHLTFCNERKQGVNMSVSSEALILIILISRPSALVTDTACVLLNLDLWSTFLLALIIDMVHMLQRDCENREYTPCDFYQLTDMFFIVFLNRLRVSFMH